MRVQNAGLNTNNPTKVPVPLTGYSNSINQPNNTDIACSGPQDALYLSESIEFVDEDFIGTPHSAILRSRIVVISSRALGEMLDKHNETYTFLRATGAVEHRAGDGVLLAISINGKHYMDRLIDPVPVRPGAVSTSRRRVEALPRTTRHKEGTKKTPLRRRAPMSIRATKPDRRICGDGRTVTPNHKASTLSKNHWIFRWKN